MTTTEQGNPSSRDMLRYYTPDPDIGLFGGRWVPRGGVLVWVQEREPAPMPAEDLQRRRGVYTACQHCGTEFEPQPGAYCSSECRATAIEARQKARRRGSLKPCATCGAIFQASRQRMKHCSDECRAKADKERHRRYSERTRAAKKRPGVCAECGGETSSPRRKRCAPCFRRTCRSPEGPMVSRPIRSERGREAA